MSEAELKQALQLIKSGDKQAGKGLLISAVRNDPYNENAWLWLASVTDGEQRIYCLQKALAINPQNEQARAYLNQLKLEAFAGNKTDREIAWEPAQVDSIDANDEDAYEDEYDDDYYDEDDYEYEYDEADLPETNQDKYLQPDGTLLFKPPRHPVLIHISLIMVVIMTGLIGFHAYKNGESMMWDLLLVMLSIPLLMILYAVICKNAGFYNIVIEDTVLHGPKYKNLPWLKGKILIQQVDLQKTMKSFSFLGDGVIFSSKSFSFLGDDVIISSRDTLIFLQGLDRETFDDLITIIWVMQLKAANGLTEQPVPANQNKKNSYETIRGGEQTMQYSLPKGEIVFKPNRRLIFFSRTLPGMLIFLPFAVYLQSSGFNNFFDLWQFYIIFPVLILHYFYRISPWFNITITDTEVRNAIPMLYGGYDRNSIKIKDIVLDETIKNWKGATFIRTADWEHVEVRGYTKEDVAHILQIIKHRQTDAYQQWVESKKQFEEGV